MPPILYIVIPCYNEEKVLPLTAPMFLEKLQYLVNTGRVSPDSRILFVEDGSKDSTWNIIEDLAREDKRFKGIRQSRNRGHQNALIAGMWEAKEHCDICITIDCDGQDDLNAMDAMVDAYAQGAEIVYGVRSDRSSDSFFKRATAQGFYKVLRALGAETVYNHADYRLVSRKVLQAFSDFREVNVYLRGMFPLVGFQSTCVPYKRQERLAGESHYPLRKMVALAFEGITSLSVKPLHLITGLGMGIAGLSFLGILWSFNVSLTGQGGAVWASTVSIVCFIGGVQLVCLGVLGEYIGKIYMEVKARPRFIISERTEEPACNDEI